jgi:hypothetical protein
MIFASGHQSTVRDDRRTSGWRMYGYDLAQPDGPESAVKRQTGTPLIRQAAWQARRDWNRYVSDAVRTGLAERSGCD